MTTGPRIGARVLLLDEQDRVLLVHAHDPEAPGNHWWELPGGGQDPGETLAETARRELTEETGLEPDEIGPQLWIHESRFRYRGRDHHRVNHFFLARIGDTTPTADPTLTGNKKEGLIEHRWWTAQDLAACTDKLVPPTLPERLAEILAGRLPTTPFMLADSPDQRQDVASARVA